MNTSTKQRAVRTATGILLTAWIVFYVCRVFDLPSVIEGFLAVASFAVVGVSWYWKVKAKLSKESNTNG